MLSTIVAGARRATAPRTSGKAIRGTSANDFEDLYALEYDKKIQCLCNMDRVQWNHQVTSALDNLDATDSLTLISLNTCTILILILMLLFCQFCWHHPSSQLISLSRAPFSGLELYWIPSNMIFERTLSSLAQECLAVLMEIDPLEKPNVKANDKNGGLVKSKCTPAF